MEKKCKKSGKKDLKLNWKNLKWKQKYKCKNCNFCFVKKDRKNDSIRWNKIFNDWIKE